MIRMYDRTMNSRDYERYFDGGGFINFGYWDANVKSQHEACVALVDRLVDRIAGKSGRILDVACGPGGSTRRLMHTYAPENISAINISKNQLAAAGLRAPGCTFILMDAVRLAFQDNSFDAVMCVEAAANFNTRDRFFREALRVLKPGGSLVLADPLFREFIKPVAEYVHLPLANFLPSTEAYGKSLIEAGFSDVLVEDVTEACVGGFCKHLVSWPRSERREGRMSFRKSVAASLFSTAIAAYFSSVCKSYVFASARKPA